MRLVMKIKDVEGMDEQKRHIILVDGEDLRSALEAHPRWLTEELVRGWLMKQPKLMSQCIEDADLRNTIYCQERQRRENMKKNNQSN